MAFGLRPFLGGAFLALALLSPFSAFAQRIQPSAASAESVLMRAAPAPSLPSLSGEIAATVNESVISMNDLSNRVKLALLSAGMPDTLESRRRVAPQVLRSLIEEQLQLQEGKRLDVNVSPEDVTQAMKRVAEDNKIPGGDMVRFLKANGVPPSALREQIKAALVWNRVVMRALRPRIDIGDDEIDAVVQRLRANAGRQEYLVSEIFLAVDKAEDEDQVRSLSENLADQIRSGATFGAVARQFSQSSSASTGGDIGWVQAGQLAPEVDKVLQTLNANAVAGPIRSASGFHIIGVREKRTVAGDLKEMKVRLEQAFHPFTAEKNKEALVAEGNEMRQKIAGCAGLQDRLHSYAGWRWQDLGEIKMGDAPSWLEPIVGNLDEGHAGEPMATDRGVLVLFLCSRSLPEGSVDRNAIRSSIGAERLEMLARRHLRDLRREALVNVRLKEMP